MPILPLLTLVEPNGETFCKRTKIPPLGFVGVPGQSDRGKSKDLLWCVSLVHPWGCKL